MNKIIAISLTSSLFLFVSILGLNTNLTFNITLDDSDRELVNTVVTPPNEHWIEWDSPEGQHRQETSQYKANLFKLLRFYESQMRGSYCGVATAVIALNALSIKAPPSEFLGKYRIFSQEEFFNGPIGEAVDKNQVKIKGLSLSDMTNLMETQPLKVNAYQAVTLTDQEIREEIITALTETNKVVIGVYFRKELKQEGNGHWAPIAAYDEESDSFLLLDVARFKYPPIWVNANTLIAAMRTSDSEGSLRGFIVLDNKE